jgi:hypothetical protein
MAYQLRQANGSEAVKISKMLRTSLKEGIEGRFNIDSQRLLNHVSETIRSSDGFALVLDYNGEPVGCFMAELQPHAYCIGHIVQETGVYIKDKHRGSLNFVRMLEEYVAWGKLKPDVLFTTFNIGQLGATTPYLRAVLKRHGFTKGDEGYYTI